MNLINKTRLCLLLVAVFGYLSMFYQYGPISGNAGDRTGGPINSGLTCNNSSGCHTSAGAYTPVVTVQLINSSNQPVTSYTPTNSYTVRITMTTSTGTNPRYGFQIVAVTASSPYTNVNAWGTPLPSGTNFKTLNSRTYIEHYQTLTSNVINLPWTAPAATTGNITFYCAGNIVNNNYTETGDNSATTSLTITPAGSGCTAPTLSASVTNVLCKGAATGGISLATSGGTPPFIFAWTGPGSFNASTQNISGLKAGLYRVVVTATGGCSDTAYATVTEPSIATTANAISNTPLCAGGSLSLSGSGTGTIPLSYSWSGSITSGSQNLYFPSATTSMSGDYILAVHDGNGCIAKDTEHVVVNDIPFVDSIGDSVKSNSAHRLYAAGPHYVQSYNWDFGDGNTDTGAVPPTHIYSMGTYSARLIVSNNCGADTFYKTVLVAEGIDDMALHPTLISIYPNPAVADFTVKAYGDIRMKSIVMYNSYGIKVKEYRVENSYAYISAAALPAGIYYLFVETGKTIECKRIELTK